MDKLVCVIPIYNEHKRILKTLEGLKEIKEMDEIVIVNDGSTDDTLKIIKNLDAKIISYDKNMGKGYAIKRAIKEINYNKLILLDGDLGETSREVKKMIDGMKNYNYDFVIGEFPEVRKVTNKKGGFGLVKNLAKNGIKFFTGIETNNSLSGQRIYKKEVIDSLTYIPNRYGVEVAMTIESLNNGFKLGEIPIEMSHRYTERNLKGFIHRGRQFKDILFTFIKMYFKGYKR